MPAPALRDKAATIERCVSRAREEYAKNPATFATDLTRQDAAILNIQRASGAALDMAEHVRRTINSEAPQNAQNAFEFLRSAGLVEPALLVSLNHMTKFCETAIRGCDTILLTALVDIITQDSGNLLELSRLLVNRDIKI